MSERVDLGDGELQDLLASGELDEAVRSGALTPEQAAERLQQAARRQAAEQGPAEDTDEDGTITSGGFGAGQGMEKQRTGQ
jgi:hypothetical protein